MNSNSNFNLFLQWFRKDEKHHQSNHGAEYEQVTTEVVDLTDGNNNTEPGTTTNDHHHQQDPDTQSNVMPTDRNDDQNSNDENVSSDEGTHQNISIDTAIERIGYGMFQQIILAAAGLCFAADAMQVLLLSFLTKQLQIEWHLSQNQVASLTATVFAGAFSGTLVLGPYADKVGRRCVFLFSGSIITAFALFGMAILTPVDGYYTLLCMIYGVGFGIGGLTVPFDIFAECLPAAHRGQQLLIIEYFWSIGALLVVVAADYYIELHWRYFVAACAMPCLLSIIFGYVCVPESPRWLLTQGRHEEALSIIKHAAKLNGFTPHDIDSYLFPPNIQLFEPNGRNEHEHQQASVFDLFQPKWRSIILRLWGTWCAMAFGYYGTILVITRVFQQHDSSGHESGTYASISQQPTTSEAEFDYSAIFVSTAAELIGTTIIIVAVDRVGRIPTQIISYVLAGICVWILTLQAGRNHDSAMQQHYHQIGDNDSSVIIVSRSTLILLGFLARIFEMCGSCVTWVMTAEVLSTDVRGAGHSTANALGRVGAFICPFIVENQPLSRVGWIMLLVHMCAVACVCTLPETAGKQLSNGGTNDTELDDNNNEEQMRLHNTHNLDIHGNSAQDEPHEGIIYRNVTQAESGLSVT